MVELAQAEIIQIYRKRAGLNQGSLGAKAFGTSLASGRTKIKNIELGRQIPTIKDIEKIATALNVSVMDLLADSGAQSHAAKPSLSGATVEAAVLGSFPGLDAYIDMLNKAARINDRELVEHICGKIAGLLTSRNAGEAVNH